MISRLTRRAALALAGAGTAIAASLGPALARLRTPTPEQTAGPFYPPKRDRFADTDADLVKIASKLREAGGEILHLRGRVLDTAGAPIAGAVVEIWQCDVNGRYLHHRDRDATSDPFFQGYGVLRTGADGAYAFRTIRPVAYTGRTPHIHARVTPPSGRALTTQLYVEGDPDNPRDFIFRSLGTQGQVAASFAVSRRADGDLEGEIDLIL